MSDALDPEDAKLVTLARGARARVGAACGAAVRDETGRTYSGADVRLAALSLGALELAVAQAVAAGARGAEAAVVVADGETAAGGIQGMDALRELAGSGVDVITCNPDGTVAARATT